MPDWAIVAIIGVVVLFGASKLPEIARNLGRSSGEFKKGLKEGHDEVKPAAPGATDVANAPAPAGTPPTDVSPAPSGPPAPAPGPAPTADAEDQPPPTSA
jgi:sec-independent protein translocase protein TatA